MKRVLASLALWLGTLAKTTGRFFATAEMLREAVDLNAFVYLGALRFVSPADLIAKPWLDALEYVGHNHRLRGLFRGLESPFFEAVALAFKAEPERVGLLPIVAQALSSEFNVQPPSQNLDWAKLENLNLRRAAIIAKISQNSVARTDLDRLTAAVPLLSGPDPAFLQACMKTAHKYLPAAEYTYFVSALYRACADLSLSLRSAAIEAIDDYLRSRHSTLHDPRTFGKLKLPLEAANQA